MSVHRTVIEVPAAARLVADPASVFLDCRFDLRDSGAGERAYAQGHVPGAHYCHLERDLSGPIAPGSGRHPLPEPAALARRIGELGVDPDTQVVAYDDNNGAMAARAWWLLRYLGHEAVAVLSGGAQAWRAAGEPWVVEPGASDVKQFVGVPREAWLVPVGQVPQSRLLVDAREPARFRGEAEPIDPVAGHIPGARNHWFAENLDEHGGFLPAAELRERFRRLLGDCPPGEAVFYCGSGVTACHNLLAMAHAGLGDGRLYAGSWSQWCADPGRAVATGD